MKKSKIRSLKDLRREKAILRQQMELTKQQLQLSWSQTQREAVNYGLWKSVLPLSLAGLFKAGAQFIPALKQKAQKASGNGHFTPPHWVDRLVRVLEVSLEAYHQATDSPPQSVKSESNGSYEYEEANP